MPNYLGNGRWSVLNTENVGGGVSWNRLTGGNGNSQITLKRSYFSAYGTIDLGAGEDTLYLGVGGRHRLFLENVEFVHVEQAEFNRGTLVHLELKNAVSNTFSTNGTFKTIWGAGGRDTITFTDYGAANFHSTTDLGYGDDELIIAGTNVLDSNDKIYGGNGADILRISTTTHVILNNDANFGGLAGSGITTERVVLTDGADRRITLSTNTEAFTINGGNANDGITSGDGSDTIYGNDGVDTIDAAGGNDRIYSGTGVYNANTPTPGNQLTGGSGSDTFYVGYGDGAQAWDNTDAVTGGALITDWHAGTDSLNVSANSKAHIGGLYGVTGLAGNDTVNLSANVSNSGTVYAYGMGGNDTMMGSTGSDQLYGGSGTNYINLGAGASDAVVIDTRSGVQHVSSFDGNDLVMVDQKVVEALGTPTSRSAGAADVSGAFNVGQAFSTGVDYGYQWRYNSILSGYGSGPYTNAQHKAAEDGADDIGGFSTGTAGTILIGVGVALLASTFGIVGAAQVVAGGLLVSNANPHQNPTYAGDLDNWLNVIVAPRQFASTVGSADSPTFLSNFGSGLAAWGDGYTPVVEFTGHSGPVYSYVAMRNLTETFVYLVRSADNLIENSEAILVAEIQGQLTAADFQVYSSANDIDRYMGFTVDAAPVLHTPTITQAQTDNDGLDNNNETILASSGLSTADSRIRIDGTIQTNTAGAQIEAGTAIKLYEGGVSSTTPVATVSLAAGASTFSILDPNARSATLELLDGTAGTGNIDQTYRIKDYIANYFTEIVNPDSGFTTRSSTFTVTVNSLTATLDGGGGTDTLMLEATSASVNNATDGQIINFEAIDGSSSSSSITIDLSNQTEAFTITGSGSNDVLYGGSGNDVLSPYIGVDFVNGQGGNDTIQGGSFVTDADQLIGGAGNDTLVLAGRYIAGQLGSITAANNIRQVENIVLKSDTNNTGQVVAGQTLPSATNGYQYDITVDNDSDPDGAIVTDVLTLDASDLKLDGNGGIAGAPAETVVFSASTVTTFKTNLIGGEANDTLQGGGLADTITGGLGADTLSGNAGNDLFVYAAEADLENGTALVDTSISGGADTDRISVAGGLTVANTVSWANASSVEELYVTGTAGSNIALDLTAQTAGIATVNISSSTTAGNVVDVSEYTTLATAIMGSTTATNTLTGGGSFDVITGGSAADTFTGGAGVDTLRGNGGNDLFLYAAEADLENGTELVDAGILGGADTDRISVAGGLTVANTVSWANATSIEELYVTGTAGSNIALDLTAQATGIATVNISSSTTAGNVVDVSEYTTLGTTIVGSAIATNTLTGGGAADAITGGSAADTITGGAGSDTLTGNAGNDVFLYAAEADLENGTALVDASISGGADTDRISVAGGLTVANTVSWANATSIEELYVTGTAGSNIALDLTAQTAGIATVNISSSTTAGNVVDVSEYTTRATTIVGSATATNTLTGGGAADTVTGGSAVDTITGGAGADTLTGNAGNDVFLYAAEADLENGTALVDASISGGADTDRISVAGGLTVENTVSWANASSIEELYVTGTAGSNIALDLTAQTAGIAAVNISSSTTAGNVVNVSEYTTLGTTIVGSATATNTLTGGGAADTITGGSAVDTITGGAGADTLSGGGADDNFVISALSDIDGLAENIYGGTSSADAGTADTITMGASGSVSIRLATISGIEVLALNSGGNAVTLTTTQHNSFSTVTASSNSDSMSIYGGGTLTGLASIEAYTLTQWEGYDFTIGATGQDVTRAGGVSGGLVRTGAITDLTGTTLSLGDSNDTLVATTTGVNLSGINAGAATTAENLIITSGISLSMTAAQLAGFSTITAAGTEQVTLTTAATGAQALSGAVETFVLAAGNNSATVGGSGQTINGDALTDGQVLTLAGTNAVSVTLVGGDLTAGSYTGAMTVTATSGTNVIATGSGADTINAGGGNDTIWAGAGADSVNGGLGDDVFVVSGSNQQIASDSIAGGGGSDEIHLYVDPTALAPIVAVFDFDNISDVLTIRPTGDTTQNRTVTFSAITEATSQTVVLNGSNMTTGALLVTNNAESSTTQFTITGGAGNDSLAGSNGADTLTGNNGNDTITGDAGADMLIGGAGVDTFVYNAVDDTQTAAVTEVDPGNVTSADVVSNFEVGTDLVNLSAVPNLTLANSSVTSGVNYHTGTANTVVLVKGTYNSVTKTFTAGNSSTDLDGLLQYSGGLTSTTVNTVVLTGLGSGIVTLTSSGEVLSSSISALPSDDSQNPTITEAVYNNTTNTLLLTFSEAVNQSQSVINDDATITWDFNGDNGDTAFPANAVTGQSTTVPNQLRFVVTTQPAADLEGNASFGGVNGVDTLDIAAGLTEDLYGNATVAASNLVIQFVWTDPTGSSSFTGGSLADTINGGSGSNTLVDGAGNDTIVTGASGDTVNLTNDKATSIDNIVYSVSGALGGQSAAESPGYGSDSGYDVINGFDFGNTDRIVFNGFNYNGLQLNGASGSAVTGSVANGGTTAGNAAILNVNDSAVPNTGDISENIALNLESAFNLTSIPAGQERIFAVRAANIDNDGTTAQYWVGIYRNTDGNLTAGGSDVQIVALVGGPDSGVLDFDNFYSAVNFIA